MKKQILKETNDMRRLMGLNLLNEEVTPVVNEMEKVGDHEERDEFDGRPSEVIGVDSDIEKQREMKEENTLNEATMKEKDAYCQKEFGKDYKDCTKAQQKQCDENCGKAEDVNEGEEKLPSMDEMKKCVSEGMSKKAVCEKYSKCDEGKIVEMYEQCKKMNEDSEGEETYHYGEDEGKDHKEEMSMEDRIGAIEDHLKHLKKDMGYDEDHEDRREKGTHFAEGKKYSEVLNTLTESEYKKLRRVIK